MLRRFPTLPTAAALLLALTAACAGGDDENAGSIPSGTPTPEATLATCTPGWSATAGLAAHTLSVDGRERRYLLHVPAGYDGTAPAPVLLMIHGLASNAQFQYDLTAIGPAADARGMIVVLPEAEGSPQYWNSRKSIDLADDVTFLQELLTDVSSSLCVDPARVYAAGYSNGGGMTLRLACDAPDMLAAVAMVSGTYLPCQADLPMVAFHGTADQVVPFEGGDVPADLGSGSFPPVRRAASEWARGIGCDGLPTIERPSDEIERSTFINCPEEGEVVLYTVLGGGHAWPGAALTIPEHIVGVTTRQLSATETMLEFFEAQSAGD